MIQMKQKTAIYLLVLVTIRSYGQSIKKNNITDENKQERPNILLIIAAHREMLKDWITKTPDNFSLEIIPE